MAHFAYVVDGIVQRVHVVNNDVITVDGVESEGLGQAFLSELHGLPAEGFVQCSYNGSIRANYPGPGWVFDSVRDAFIAPEPEPDDEIAEWVLDEETFSWVPVGA